jgi:uncharacterized protein YbjT (DUF2867 family)
MFVITGATGNTGSGVAERLLARGEKVRVIGRSAERLQRFVAKGAEAFVAEASDAEAMTRALGGATAAYLMIPPSYETKNVAAHQDAVIAAYATAVEKSGLRYAVALSSIGAQHAERVGPIKGLHRLEQRLGKIAGLNVLFLRAGFFMENTLQYIGLIKSLGMIAGTQLGDKAHPWIATRDIAEAAASALVARDFTGAVVRDLLGPRDVSLNEAASIIGAAIGKPGLSYTRVSAMMMKPALLAMGFSSDAAANLLEMFEAADAGLLAPQAPRSAESATPTAFEQFVAQEFLPRYRGQAVAGT